MRRVIATAAIAFAAAGIIGLTSPAATAAPAHNEIAGAGECDVYRDRANEALSTAQYYESIGDAANARAWHETADSYMTQYYQCLS